MAYAGYANLDAATGQVVAAQIPAGSLTYKLGTATYGGSTASGTQTIAHGLGKTPTLVRMSASWGPASSNAQSQGAYDGTTNACTYGYWRTNSTTTGASPGSGNILILVDALNGGQQAAVATFDATNITLTWTKTGSTDSPNIAIFWQVQG